MKCIFKLAFIVAGLLVLNVPAFAQAKDDYTAKIDSLIHNTSPRPFNGVVLVTQKGKAKYSKALGYANFDKKTLLTSNDAFEIMSNTKQITAVLILREYEKGKIDLQAPIKTYLPTLTETWADSVTVHQLLNHTHGIVDLAKPLAFRPGSDFKYGNLSNILLGKIIENVSHKTYRELANALFQSLNMKHTFCYAPNDRKNLVYGHMENNNVFTVVDSSFINDENLPADGVITTAKDLSIWNAKLHKGNILKPATYPLMTTASALSQHDVFGQEKTGYGYNIRIVAYNGVKYLGHTGLGEGFASMNIYIPKADVSIIVLENLMSDNSDLYYYFEAKIKEIVLNSCLVK